jgi:peptidoglycan/LPS O-acetylase OafA/YrhL
MLAAVLAEGRSLNTRGARRLIAAGMLAVLVDLAVHSGPIGSPVLLFGSETIRDLPAALGFAAIVVAAASRARGVLGSRPLVALGSVSYGVYLWNVPLLLGLRAIGALPLDPLSALPIVVALTIAIATLSWLVVERPAIGWARTRVA